MFDLSFRGRVLLAMKTLDIIDLEMDLLKSEQVRKLDILDCFRNNIMAAGCHDTESIDAEIYLLEEEFDQNIQHVTRFKRIEMDKLMELFTKDVRQYLAIVDEIQSERKGKS